MATPKKLYKASSAKPLDKIVNGGIAGAITGPVIIILLWVIGLTGVQVPDTVQQAVTALITLGVTLLVAYQTPISAGEVEPVTTAPEGP